MICTAATVPFLRDVATLLQSKVPVPDRMYTQCPECLTIYEIDEDALQASLGIVFCGRCAKRFDALRTLSDTLPLEPLASLPELEPTEQAPTLTVAVPESAFEAAASKRRTRENPDTAPQTGSSQQPSVFEPPLASDAGRTPADDSADDWFANFEFELADPAVGDIRDTSAPAPNDNEWSVELPEQADAAAGYERATDTVDDTAVDASGLVVSTSSEPESVDLEAEPTAFMPDVDVPASAEAVAEHGADESVASALTESPAAEAEPETATAPAPVYVRPRSRGLSRAGVASVIGCLVLALVLAAQLGWARRVALFRNPATQSWVARVCQNLPCRLPPIQDIAKLELLSRDVRPDPNAASALMITATVRNDATFRQPWPVVVVELTDLDNRPVAMRRFRPTEYLPDAAARAAGIAPGATAALAFEVADPGKRAVAFQFSFE